MPKPYDDAMKKLVGGNSQDFLSWVLRDAQFVRQLPYELSVENIYADGLIEALSEGERTLVHFEFQSYYDERIGERLLEYNVLASRQYGYVPVDSFVIYLKDCGEVPRSPFLRKPSADKEGTRFSYGIIELHKSAAEELVQTGLVALLPLLPLTGDGARRQVIENMILSLIEADRTDLLWIGYALAAKIMKDDIRWLKRRFAMLSDFLQDSPVYQEVLEEGIEKGLEIGREEGRREAISQQLQRERQSLREAVLDVVLERFPEIARQVKRQTNTIDDPAIMLGLLVKIGTAKSAEEVSEHLHGLNERNA